MVEKIVLSIPGFSNDIIMEKASDVMWKNIGGSIMLEIEEGTEREVYIKFRDDNIPIDDEFLLELFLEQKAELEKRIIDQEVSGVEIDEEVPAEIIDEIYRPDFDPEQIRVDPKVFSLLDIIRFIDQSRIDLSPDFQRHFVWKDIQQSRLIESLLLRIPLPVFYLSEDEDGLYQVVDGLQRLTTIHRFIKNKLKLKGLEYLNECEGYYFSSIPPKYQRRLEDTQLTFNVIAPTTPISVKFEIFKRINEGGKPLNRQEIRNSMAKPHIRDFIKKLASSTFFKIATDNSVKAVRMEDQELILRFIGFYLAQYGYGHQYKGEMESFLDDTLDFLNKKATSSLLNEQEKGFYLAMRNAKHLFGHYAFRKITSSDPHNYRRPLINKSLFTVWSVLLSNLEENDVKLLPPDFFIAELAKFIKEDKDYLDSLTTGTNQANKIDYGFKVANTIIYKHLKSNV